MINMGNCIRLILKSVLVIIRMSIKLYHAIVLGKKMDEWYFVFYTSRIKTKVVFEKKYVSNYE